MVTGRKRVSGSKGAEVLRQTSLVAQLGLMQPKVHVEIKRLLSTIFLHLQLDLVSGWAFAALPLAFAEEEEVH